MGVAADSTVVVIIGQMQIAGHEPGGNSARAERRYHKHGEVTATAAPDLERPGRSLDSLLVPRDVLEALPDGPRHVAEQIVSVGGAILTEERGAPEVDRGMRG